MSNQKRQLSLNHISNDVGHVFLGLAHGREMTSVPFQEIHLLMSNNLLTPRVSYRPTRRLDGLSVETIDCGTEPRLMAIWHRASCIAGAIGQKKIPFISGEQNCRVGTAAILHLLGYNASKVTQQTRVLSHHWEGIAKDVKCPDDSLPEDPKVLWAHHMSRIKAMGIYRDPVV